MFSNFAKIVPRFSRLMANIQPPKVDPPKEAPKGCGCNAPKKSCCCWTWIAGATLLGAGAYYYCSNCKKNGKQCCICSKICPKYCKKVECPPPEVKKPIEPAEKPSQKSA